ncbi:transcriptional regulator [Gemmatimonadota bacterium]
MSEPESAGNGSELRRSLQELDKLLEHRLRLAIMVLLSRYDELSFSRIKELTGETDGNLGANLRRLEDAGYLKARKQFVERKPVTWYSLESKGRKALDAHLTALSDLIADAGSSSR